VSVKRAVMGMDLGEVHALLDRVRSVVSPSDYARLAGLIEMLIELTRLVRAKGATIARLRRLLGHVSTEKTQAVLGEGSRAAADEVGSNGQGSGASVPGDGSTADNETRLMAKRKGHGRRPASTYEARHIGVPHPRLHAGDCCPGCGRGKLHRLLDPAQYLRLFGQAPLIAICWDCERLRCGACGQVFTASPPAEAIGPKYSESAVSMMALLRYGTGLPLNRLGRLQDSLGVPVPASTQWEAVLERVAALVPVYKELVRRAADGSVVHNDDTYMRILEFMGRRRAQRLADGRLPDPDRTGLFTTAIVSVTDSGLIALFLTGRRHAGENLAGVLAERCRSLPPPIQMCDGLERNRPQGHDVIESNCLAHGRRHVVEEAENFSEECRHVLEQLGLVFHNEALCKKKGWSGEERLRFHQEQSGPVMDSLAVWMSEQIEQKRIEPNSGLGQALLYLLKRWEKLTLFLRARDAPLENNICERVMKMAIRHRRNSLFYRSTRGARVGDIYMTLLYTAQLHGENPFAYLTALLAHEALVTRQPAHWLPWNYRATLERLKRRAVEAA
jgi:transposase